MKIYELEVMSCGTYWIIDLNDKSGCSDVERDCWQEAVFTVAAESIERAAGLVLREYEKCNKEWSNSCDALYYNPNPLSVEDDEGDEEEILDYSFHFPKEGDGAEKGPLKYSKEAQTILN